MMAERKEEGGDGKRWERLSRLNVRAPARPAPRRSITPENKLRESRPIAFLCDAVISFSIMSFDDVAWPIFKSPANWDSTYR